MCWVAFGRQILEFCSMIELPKKKQKNLKREKKKSNKNEWKVSNLWVDGVGELKYQRGGWNKKIDPAPEHKENIQHTHGHSCFLCDALPNAKRKKENCGGGGSRLVHFILQVLEPWKLLNRKDESMNTWWIMEEEKKRENKCNKQQQSN